MTIECDDCKRLLKSLSDADDEIERLRGEAPGQSARAQSGQGAEPVAWLHQSRPETDVITDAVKRCWGHILPKHMQYSIPLYTHPQPAQHGSVPEEEERLTDIYRRKFFECHDELNNLRSEYHNRTAELEVENEDLRQELQSMRPQPAVPEEYRQALQDAYDIIVCDANSPENYGSLCRIGHVLGQITTPTTPQDDGWVNLVEGLAKRAESENISVEVVFDDGYAREEFDTDISEHVANWLRSLKRPQPPKEGYGNEH